MAFVGERCGREVKGCLAERGELRNPNTMIFICARLSGFGWASDPQFMETGFIVCLPLKINLWRRAPRTTAFANMN